DPTCQYIKRDDSGYCQNVKRDTSGCLTCPYIKRDGSICGKGC
ncbi:1267_t:CDS:1, partial [Diversispora eburnea]